MAEKKIRDSELVGIVVVYSMAVLLHFVYPLSGNSTLSILFGAVNESVWEHVKIFAAAYVTYAVIQLMWVRVPFRRYVAAKVIGLYALSLGIITFYYLYTAIVGESVAAVNVLSSLLFVIGAQGLSLWLTEGSKNPEPIYYPALCLLMLFFLMFFSFTIFPPRIDLFRDPVSGMFGITEENVDVGAIVLSMKPKKL